MLDTMRAANGAGLAAPQAMVAAARRAGKATALGYGYLAFWGLDSEPRYWLQKAVDWNAPSGHNGWLDLAISLGLVGGGGSPE